MVTRPSIFPEMSLSDLLTARPVSGMHWIRLQVNLIRAALLFALARRLLAVVAAELINVANRRRCMP